MDMVASVVVPLEEDGMVGTVGTVGTVDSDPMAPLIQVTSITYPVTIIVAHPNPRAVLHRAMPLPRCVACPPRSVVLTVRGELLW